MRSDEKNRGELGFDEFDGFDLGIGVGGADAIDRRREP